MNSIRNPYAVAPSTLETERLVMRAPTLEDAFALQELAEKDASFARHTVGEVANTLYANCTAIARMREERITRSGAWWIVSEKESGRSIGLAGYSGRAASTGINCILAHPYSGNGYTHETLSILLALGRSGYDLATRGTRKEPQAATANRFWHCKAS